MCLRACAHVRVSVQTCARVSVQTCRRDRTGVIPASIPASFLPPNQPHSSLIPASIPASFQTISGLCPPSYSLTGRVQPSAQHRQELARQLATGRCDAQILGHPPLTLAARGRAACAGATRVGVSPGPQSAGRAQQDCTALGRQAFAARASQQTRRAWCRSRGGDRRLHSGDYDRGVGLLWR